MTRERLEPVTSWDALRTLLRVVVKGCQVCGGEHAGTLVEKDARRVPIRREAGVVVDWATVWIVSPRPSCAKEAGRLLGRASTEWVVTPLAVDQGRVFVVVDGDEKAETTTRTRTLENVE